MIGPLNGNAGSVVGTEPVASTTCSALTTCGPVSVSTRQVLPSTITARPCRILTRCLFRSAPTPLVRRPTMPFFHSIVRAKSMVGRSDEGLRRNAADIEAGAAQPAIETALLHQHDIEAKLAGPDG